MTPVTAFKGRTVAVFGLGKSGISTCKSLMTGGANVIAFDDAPGKVNEAQDAGIKVGDLRQVDWKNVAVLVLAPGVPFTHPAPHWSVKQARMNDVEIIGDIELFCRERRARAPRAPFVAITGTNGKSTTTALIGHIVARSGRDTAVGGNLGTPILELLPPSRSRTHVIECSSYQIDLSPTLDPSVGVLLNLSPDHLDRHGTMREYAAVKERLITGIERGGTAVIGIDDEFCEKIANDAARAGIKVVCISAKRKFFDNGIFFDGENIVDIKDNKKVASIPLRGINSLRGLHNGQNAAAAYATARALGIGIGEIDQGMRTFPGLAHRMEEVGRKEHVLFINDSKATNADATARALDTFKDIFWIAGGRAKQGGVEGLVRFFPKIRKAYLIGEAAESFAEQIKYHLKYEIAGTLEKAVEMAAADAKTSDLSEPVVLLSPACASFDQFANFEVRGDTFRKLVRAMP